MAKTKVYISGPMTGLPEYNYPAFDAMEAALKAKGFDPVSPVKVCEGMTHDTSTWEDFMRANIKAMMDCDGVIFLHGWPNSKGARIEHALALGLGMFRVRELPSGDFSFVKMGR